MKSELDKFYTKPSVAKRCIDLLTPYITDDDTLIEPSAGNGSFSSLIECAAYDIAPEHPSIIQQDWLSFIPPVDCVVFGNPPFGNRNKLTDDFILHAMKYAKIIAFVLPKVYNKEGKQKIFTDEWSLVCSEDLPRDAFLLDGKTYNVPCVFHIWMKNSQVDLRESKKPKVTTNDFEFSKDGDWFLFGAAPQNIIPSEEKLLTNRGYFVKADEKVIERLRNINWKEHALSSVSGGVAWFTKQQIISIYERNVNDRQQQQPEPCNRKGNGQDS